MTAPAPAAPTTPEIGTEPPANPAGDDGAGSKAAILADLARERDRRQAAENKAAELDKLQVELQQFRDAGKTAEQKQAEQLTTLTGERDTATVKALRYEVCEETELPLKAARFLTGTTKAEIEASAKDLKALGAFGATSQPPGTGLPGNPNGGQQTPAKAKSVSAGREMFASKQTAPAVK